MSLLSARGFSLIELMIAIGVAGIISLGMASMTSQQAKMQARTMNYQQAQMHIGLVNRALSYAGTCDYNLKNPNFTNLQFDINNPNSRLGITQLQIPSGANFASLTSVNFPVSNSYWIKNLYIDSLQRVASSNNFMAKLHLIMSSDSPVATALTNDQWRDFVIPINVTASVAGTTATATNCTTGTVNSSSGASLFANWPDHVICGGAVFDVLSPGVYHAYMGGEKTTRSSIIRYNQTTRKIASINTAGSVNPCPTGNNQCCTMTMDELASAGLAK